MIARREPRVAVPDSTRRAVQRAIVRVGGIRPLVDRLRISETTVYDALATMGMLRPAALERVQAGLRELGEQP